MKQYDPPIRDQDWGSLPFPFMEMQSADVEVRATDTSQTFNGFLWIDRHETDDNLFSAVVVISELPTANWAVHTQLRIRLAPSATAAIERTKTDDSYRYRVAFPLSAIGFTRLPDQLKP
jgi:hypothetical protein